MYTFNLKGIKEPNYKKIEDSRYKISIIKSHNFFQSKCKEFENEIKLEPIYDVDAIIGHVDIEKLLPALVSSNITLRINLIKSKHYSFFIYINNLQVIQCQKIENIR